MKILYLGPEGSYSYIAAKHKYPHETLVCCSTFDEIFEGIKKDKTSVGVLPVENSITSNVHENIDKLFESKELMVIGELYVKISLNLISLKSAKMHEITDVYSHPKALAQCTKFIKRNLLKTHSVESTAQAQNLILSLNNKCSAAIGSSALVDKSALQIINANIGNEQNNMTRFLFISRSDKKGKKVDKATIIFSTKHEPGSLAKVLTALAAIDVNLTKIESRPIPGTDWQYSFWIDIHLNDQKIETVATLLDSVTLFYRILGTYTKGLIIES